ncbi:MAG: flavin monoamine oxidase family protein [Microbacterium sp.]|uniref:flavin monoamine oxidase family protein n=1 Tax=Microbacterium sp. TaxID=51671 RepID=UPI003F9DFAAC
MSQTTSERIQSTSSPVIETDVDVIVIGAGLAGLTAARRLVQFGHTVRLFEADDRVGGRALSAEAGGVHIDLGGTFVGRTQDRIMALADEVGVRRYATYDSGDNVIRWRQSLRRYSGTVPPMGAALLDVGRIQLQINRIAETIPLGRPWEAPRAAELDSLSLGSWLERNRASHTARDLIALACRTTWGCEPSELSMLHAAHYIHQAGGLASMLDTAGGAQEEHFVEGTHAVALRVAAELGDLVTLSTPVRKIDWSGPGAIVTTDKGQTRARQVIVAVPPALRRRIEFTPLLPPRYEQLSQRWAQGVLSKAYAIYEEPFWRRNGLSGQGLSDRGPAFITFDASPEDASRGVLLGFIGGIFGQEWDHLDEPERRARALASFADLFGPAALRPIAYIDQRWGSEIWTGGGPTAAPGPGTVLPYARYLTEPIGPIRWAGTETSDRWSGFLDGAVRSGERSARDAHATLALTAD